MTVVMFKAYQEPKFDWKKKWKKINDFSTS
jgi:hypothetical protein